MGQLHCLQENLTLKYLADRVSGLSASDAMLHWCKQEAKFSIHLSFPSWGVLQQWNAEVTNTADMGWGSKRWLNHSKNRHSTSASHHSYAWAITPPLAPAWQISDPKLTQFISQDRRKFQSFFFLGGKAFLKEKQIRCTTHTHTKRYLKDVPNTCLN